MPQTSEEGRQRVRRDGAADVTEGTSRTLTTGFDDLTSGYGVGGESSLFREDSLETAAGCLRAGAG